MTYSQAWMKFKNPKLATSKMRDIQVQRKRGPIMVAVSELRDKDQVQSFQDLDVKQPFKLAKMESIPAKNLVRAKFYRASTTEEYPWNKTPIMVTYLYAQNNYVFPRIPRKAKAAAKEQPKSKSLVARCPVARLQPTLPSKPKYFGARVGGIKARPAMLKLP